MDGRDLALAIGLVAHAVGAVRAPGREVAGRLSLVVVRFDFQAGAVGPNDVGLGRAYSY